ncbi:MAG: HpcH/HpaI aldolase family protein [Minwuia sp.]|uniref:HpcH/HpaI aldolase family protein n=1 Tax=Minwuia sp. TaxID=2493630 RepID=UPI003A859CA9
MPVQSNPLKPRLAGGETAFGTMMFEFLSPGLPQIARNAGADFLFYDMEHSGFDFVQMKTQIALCHGAGVVPLVRPPAKQYQFAARLLDCGAMGLMYQMVESAEEAEELVSWSRYPPRGERGALFGGAHDSYRTLDVAAGIAAAEARTLNIMLIETAKGLENVDAIAAVEGVDILHIGHLDLSISLGRPGDMSNPDLQAGIDAIAAAAAKHGRTAATVAGSLDWGRDLMRRGYRMISWSFDSMIIQDGLTAGIAALKSA